MPRHGILRSQKTSKIDKKWTGSMEQLLLGSLEWHKVRETINLAAINWLEKAQSQNNNMEGEALKHWCDLISADQSMILGQTKQ